MAIFAAIRLHIEAAEASVLVTMVGGVLDGCSV